MIIQFRFKNFRSFKDETILDMKAEPISDFKDRPYLFKDKSPREQILTCAVIYGANASGKSNFLDAMEFMKEFITNFNFQSKFSSSKYELKVPRELMNFYYQPFLLAENSNTISEFEISFLDKEDNKIYNYGFSIDGSKIIEEWLNIRAKTSKNFRTIFYRDNDNLELLGLKKADKSIIKASFKPNSLILSTGSVLNIPILKKVFDWFENLYFFNSEHFIGFMQQTTMNPLINQLKEKDLPEVKNYLSSFDPSIIGLKLKETSDNEKKLFTIHKITKDKDKEFQFDMESAGTKKMLSLYFYLKETLINGGVLIIDELSSHLHANLIRFILLLFLDKKTNPNYAQLIFTSQDIWILSNELFRRDEIWFVDKDENNISNLYSLYNIVDEKNQRVRKDEKFNKNYILGEYGAIPNLSEFNFFQENQ